ncbi:MAG: FtsW/RodA/SpoVE family cell cycle protein, partial [Burkholderiaceae bacterium]
MNDRRAHEGWRAVGLWARQRFMALDQPLFFIFCGLVGLSLLAVYSASHHDPERFFSHTRNLALAGLVMFILAQIPSNWLQKTAIPLYVIGLLLLLAVELFGQTTKGATRWLDLGITRIQPSELMKIAMPLMLAWGVHQRDGLKTARDWVVIVLLLLLPVALILRQPDLGTAILVAASGIFVIYLAGLSWRLIGVVVGSALWVILLLIA